MTHPRAGGLPRPAAHLRRSHPDGPWLPLLRRHAHAPERAPARPATCRPRLLRPLHVGAPGARRAAARDQPAPVARLNRPRGRGRRSAVPVTVCATARSWSSCSRRWCSRSPSSPPARSRSAVLAHSATYVGDADPSSSSTAALNASLEGAAARPLTGRRADRGGHPGSGRPRPGGARRARHAWRARGARSAVRRGHQPPGGRRPDMRSRNPTARAPLKSSCSSTRSWWCRSCATCSTTRAPVSRSGRRTRSTSCATARSSSPRTPSTARSPAPSACWARRAWFASQALAAVEAISRAAGPGALVTAIARPGTAMPSMADPYEILGVARQRDRRREIKPGVPQAWPAPATPTRTPTTPHAGGFKEINRRRTSAPAHPGAPPSLAGVFGDDGGRGGGGEAPVLQARPGVRLRRHLRRLLRRRRVRWAWPGRTLARPTPRRW